MIYDEPIFLIGGDSFVTIELGNDGSLSLNLYILALEKMILESKIPGLIDTASLRNTIMIRYNPFVIHAYELIEYLKGLISSGVKIPPIIPSRLIYLPVYYNDPWTRDCAKEHGYPPNLEILAKENNISVDEVIEIHSHSKYFVSYTSFMFGSFGSFPIDPITHLKNSKYKTPRKWSPSRNLGLHGNTTGFCPIVAPSGVMMLGRVPVKTFDIDGENKFFRKDLLLLHPGDQLRFIPIDGTEYEYSRKNLDDYTYKIDECYIDTSKL